MTRLLALLLLLTLPLSLRSCREERDARAAAERDLEEARRLIEEADCLRQRR